MINRFLNKIKSRLSFTATNRALHKEEEYRLYEKVSQDIAQGKRDEGVWTLAFAKSDGHQQSTEALYIELMVQKLKDEMEASRELVEEANKRAEEDKKKSLREEAERKRQEALREYRKKQESLKADKIQQRKEKKEKRGLVWITLSFSLLFIILLFVMITLNKSPSSKPKEIINLEELTKTKYTSLHDDTYWFINNEFQSDDYVASVRSNLVWADRMSVFLSKTNCRKPEIYIQLTTKKIKSDYPEFNFSSLESKSIQLGLDFDGKYFEQNAALVIGASQLNNGNHLVILHLGDVYDTFLALDEKYDTLWGWQYLTMTILETDPNRKYFDLPERQYRMLDFPGAMVNLINDCEEDNKSR